MEFEPFSPHKKSFHKNNIFYISSTIVVGIICALIIIALERSSTQSTHHKNLLREIAHLQKLVAPLTLLHEQQEKLIIENKKLTTLLTTMHTRIQHQKLPFTCAEYLNQTINNSIKINSCRYFFKKYFILTGVAQTTNSFTLFLSTLTEQNQLGPVTVLDTCRDAQDILFKIKIGLPNAHYQTTISR